MSADELAAAKKLFEEHWNRIEVVEPSAELVRSAGEMSEVLGLRGYDAVQLVSAMSARSTASDVYMLTWDNDLARAAYDAGISTIRTSRA